MAFRGTAPLAALTTIFTPPCPTSWLVTTSKVPSQFPSFPGAGSVPTCNPPSWQDNLSAEGFNYYSPAICPSGFEVGPGCLLTTTPRTSEGFPSVAPGETVAWCVPSGQSCTSDTTDFRGGYWGASQTATATGALVTVGPAMQIRFRDTDLSILETHPLTPGLTLAGLATLASTSDAATTTSSASQKPLQTSAASTRTASSSLRVQTARGPSTTGTANILSSGTTAGSSPTTAPPQPKSTASQTAGLGPSASGSNDNDDDDDTGTSSTAAAIPNHTPSSHTRAFAATVSMSCLLGVTALGIGVYFFRNRRRRHNRKKGQQAARDAEQGGDTGAAAGSSADGAAAGGRGMAFLANMANMFSATTPTPSHTNTNSADGYDRAPASRMLSVGVGAWVPDTVNKAKMRWAGLRHTRKLKDHQEREEVQQAEDTIAAPTRAVLASLPRLELNLGDEKFGHSNDNYADADADSEIGDMESVFDTYGMMSKTKGIPSKPRGDRTSARQSWMSRLSRYMRGDQGRSTPMSGSNSPSPSTNRASSKVSPISRSPGFTFDFDTGRRVLHKNDKNDKNSDSHDSHDDDEIDSSHASTRWSRWTRADTVSIVTDAADYHGHQRGLSDPNRVRADSWEAFSRSHQGLGRILAAKKSKGSARSPTTDRSGGAGVQRDSRWLSVDSKHLSRASDGTFGRMDSFVSKASSQTTEMPPVKEEQRQYGSDSEEEKGVSRQMRN